MTDYLSSIVLRSLNKAEVIKPRLPSIFEPPHPSSEDLLLGYTPRVGAEPMQRYEDYKPHKDINFFYEPMDHKRSMQNDPIVDKKGSEDSILENLPVRKAEEINVSDMEAEIEDDNLPLESSAHGRTMPRKLIGYRSSLGLEEDAKRAESEMEEAISDSQSPFRQTKSKTVESDTHRSIEQGTKLTKLERPGKTISGKKSFFAHTGTKISESEKHISIEPETKLARSSRQEVRPDWKSKEHRETGHNIKSMNLEYGAEPNNRHKDPKEFNGLLDSFQFRPNSQVSKNTGEKTFQSSSNSGNKENVLKWTNPKTYETDNDIASSNPLLPQLKSSPPFSLFPESDAVASTEIKPLRISGRDDLLFESNSMSLQARAYYKSGRHMAVAAQAKARHVTDSKPDVQVTIGRIEVKAIQQIPSLKPIRQGPKVPSLDEYLSKRARGDIV
jgi:hypothetical protein